MTRKKNIITRRDLLEKGMAAATVGAAGLLAAPSVIGKARRRRLSSHDGVSARGSPAAMGKAERAFTTSP